MEQETIFAVNQEKKQKNNSYTNNESQFTYIEKTDKNITNDLKTFKNKLNDFYEKLKNI